MTPMGFMLRSSIDIMPLSLYSPALWVALAALVVAVVVTKRVTSAPAMKISRRTTEILGLVIAPVAMLLIGIEYWPQAANERSQQEAFADAILYVIGAAQLALALWLVWRHRRNVALTGLSSALALWWTTSAWAIASMAISNIWL